MEIWHRIALNSKKDEKTFKEIQILQVDYKTIELPGGESDFVYFDIAESDRNWPIISNLFSKYGALNRVETFFTDEEIRNAEWLRMISVFEQGYPQPKNPWPFKQSDRDLLCSTCAIYQQIAPMHIAKEPHMGKKSFTHTIWTMETFCTPDVFQGLKEINAKGYESWDVILHKSRQISEKVRQLYVPSIASPGFLAEEDLGRVTCPECGTTKYYANMRGIMKIKKEAIIPDVDFMLTNEWFGSGYIAWREILVSNRVASMILDKGWQGLRFKVVDIV